MYFIDCFPNFTLRLVEAYPCPSSFNPCQLHYVTTAFRSFPVVNFVILTLWPGVHSVPLVFRVPLRAASQTNKLSRTSKLCVCLNWRFKFWLVYSIHQPCDQDIL